MSEDNFPSEMSMTIVDDLFNNYTLGCGDEAEDIDVYCETCEDIVCTLDYDAVSKHESDDLYELIIEEHKEI